MQIALLPDTGSPLYRQLFDTLRRAILEGALRPGERLSPTRDLARDMSLSRNTVCAAYDMLQAEGYVSSRRGAGFFVVDVVPETPVGPSCPAKLAPTVRGLSRRGAVLASATRPVPKQTNPAFQRGLPALDEFPFQVWHRHLAKYSRGPAPALMRYQDDGGLIALKEALQEYLGLSRGVRCEANQVIIVAGGQAALDLATRLLVDEGDSVAIEEPGYLGARDALLAAGANLQPVPVDQDGLRVSDMPDEARLAYVTPSYQFPLGVTMSAARRLELLQWATQQDAYVIEDDYDSEFRFSGRPLSCLQGLDDGGRVIYVGTFSKVMYPALRLGYIVAPAHLAASFAAALRKTGQDAPLLIQAAMADFIRSGHFASHIRRMRTLYAARQTLFMELVERHLSKWLLVRPTEAGMQLACYFTQPVDESHLAIASREAGIDIGLLSGYYLGDCPCPGLFMGYSGVAEKDMEANVLTLRDAFMRTGS